MPLRSGTRLGPYIVVSLLGAGGMGEVYRGRDTNLRRDVALKILPGRLAADRDRLARFTREARTLAALNHPHIAQVHGFEEHGGVRALVMELVEGEDLAERLRRGPIALEEALPVACQIADALEAAHAHGVIHRDLKPANIMVRVDGTVKVLDLGLAKALDRPGALPSVAATATSAEPGTEVGVIMGTAPYMSPEQARGGVVDRSTDIWAFGCVLYEMLTGTRAFDGSGGPDTLANVLKREPEWGRLPAATPPAIRVLLRRCLRKDRRERLQDAAGVRIEIEDVLRDLRGTPPPAAGAGAGGVLVGGRQQLAVGSALVIGALIAAVAVWHVTPVAVDAPRGVSRMTLFAPAGEQLYLPSRGMAVAPDGKHVAYVTVRRGLQQLYLRPIDRLDATVLPGTEGASAPFFSPDSQWLGFFADGKLKKMPVTGGAPQVLCDAQAGHGGSWGSNGVVYFAPGPMTGVWQVAETGGTPRPFTTLQHGEITHRWPEVLPGGHAVLFTSRTGPGADERQVQVQRVSDGERRMLVRGDTGAYVPTGHLVYVQVATGTLFGVPFDATSLEVAAIPPVTLARGVDPGGEGAHYAVSHTGLLAYVTGRSRFDDSTLVWVDRGGNADPVSTRSRAYDVPRLSPSGSHVAFMSYGPRFEVWIHDIDRGDATKLLSDGSDQFPIWTPDGTRLTYRGTRAGTRNIFWRMADGSGTEERLTAGRGIDTPGSWSPDGQILLLTTFTDNGSIMAMRIADRTQQPFVQTRFTQAASRFSPDGRWVAYSSNESGQSEIYVRPYPGPGGKRQVSTEGGTEPVWNPSGRELFYRDASTMMGVDITTEPPTIRIGKPTPLFTGNYVAASTALPNFDVSRDGQRFLMVRPISQETTPPSQIVVVLNWFEELTRLVPPH